MALILLCGGTQLPGQETPPEVIFSLDGGRYDSSLVLKLYEPGGGDIFFTRDGSQPDKDAPLYRGPLPIEENTVIRAFAVRDGVAGPVYTQTYLLRTPPTDLPVLALSIEPWKLFDSEQGLFLQGSRADTGTLHLRGANFWSRAEVLASLEFYEIDGSCVFNSPIGLRLFGGISRLWPQKSLALFAREEYGEKYFYHRVFGKDGPKKIKRLVLRNAGSDFGKAHIRDAFITQVAKDWEVDVQDYRPAHVYINGQYWGIYNLREKINERFLADHHDVDKDSLDLLEHLMTVKSGSRRRYQEFLHYLETHDLSRSEVYQEVGRMMEINSFIDLQIAQIYFDNRDAGGNIRYWRPRDPDGRWRWILFDMDWGMGLHDADAYLFNSLRFHTEPDGPSWPNPPWSTFVLRTLLENPAFRQVFVTRFADRLNTDLQPQTLMAKIDAAQRQLSPEMPQHFERWNLPPRRWKNHLNRMRHFAAERRQVCFDHLQEFFGLQSPVAVNIEVGTGGRVVINRNLEWAEARFSGAYFPDYPLYLRAEANLGYRFVHWVDADGQKVDAESLLLPLDESGVTLRAVFEPYDHDLMGQLVFNEIGPTNKKTKDWIELYNRTDRRIWLDGYVIRDKKENVFHFPEGSFIDGRNYLIVCEDGAAFRERFPQTYNVIGGLGFGINKHRETLQLFDPRNANIDSIGYRLEPTDSVFTWNLLLPSLDNGNPENWVRRMGEGTPSRANPYYVESRVLSVQSRWIKLSLGLAVFVLLVFFVYHQLD